MIDKMKHYSMNNLPSVYDEEALTALELSGRTAKKMNEVIDTVNEEVDFMRNQIQGQNREIENHIEAHAAELNNHKNVIIPSEVRKAVKKHIEDGEFNKAISLYLNNLEDRVDNLLGSLEEGSTTADAELIDLRVDAFGMNFGDASGARSFWDSVLFNKVDSHLAHEDEEYVDGYFAGKNGANTPSEFFKRFDIDVREYRGKKVILKASFIQSAGMYINNSARKCVYSVVGDDINSDTSQPQYHVFTVPEDAETMYFSIHKDYKSWYFVIFTGEETLVKMMKDYSDRTLININLTQEMNNDDEKFIVGGNGKEDSSTMMMTSKPIDISGHDGEILTIKCCMYSYAGYAYYNSEGEYISGYNQTTAGFSGKSGYVFTHSSIIPEGAHYIRFTLYYNYSSNIKDYFITIHGMSKPISELLSELSETASKASESASKAETLIKEAEEKLENIPDDVSSGTPIEMLNVKKILFIGDSLTAGAYYHPSYNGSDIPGEHTFPSYFKKISGIDYYNVSQSGASFDYISYGLSAPYPNDEGVTITVSEAIFHGFFDAVVLWLGTNNGWMVEVDTETGIEFDTTDNYISNLRHDCNNSNTKLIGLTCFASTGDKDMLNNRIKTSSYFDYVIDMDDGTLYGDGTEDLHPFNNEVHFGVYGNMKVAEKVYQGICEFYKSMPKSDFELKG